MCKAEHAKAIDRAVFPGLQGGPHNHTTGALAVALKEALSPDFKTYARHTVDNCQALAQRLLSHGFSLVSGGTDNHLLLLDLTNKGDEECSQCTRKAGSFATRIACLLIRGLHSIPVEYGSVHLP